eukprot:2070580-Pleurochrysis_carterae.AAC.2
MQTPGMKRTASSKHTSSAPGAASNRNRSCKRPPREQPCAGPTTDKRRSAAPHRRAPACAPGRSSMHGGVRARGATALACLSATMSPQSTERHGLPTGIGWPEKETAGGSTLRARRRKRAESASASGCERRPMPIGCARLVLALDACQARCTCQALDTRTRDGRDEG